LRGEFGVCYQRRVSSPVDKPWSMAAGEHQKSLWITSGLVVCCLCVNPSNHKTIQEIKGE